MPEQTEHIHSYQRIGKERNFSVREDRKIYYRCVHPKCFHKMNAIELVGKECLCCKCGLNKFLLSRSDLSKARPVCPQCSGTKQGKLIAAAQSITDDILSSLQEQFNQD